MSRSPEYQPLGTYHRYGAAEMRARADQYLALVRRRRTVRDFSAEPVDRRLIESCLLAAGTAPSGANLQPWHFCVIGDPAVKRQIRAAAEIEEREFYGGRAPQAWLDALAPLGTDANKPFLETAPWLIVIFARGSEPQADGSLAKTYYATESVGIATGILITALHHAGLATLTHTPSPMKFLNTILGRPREERPFVLLVTGYPAAGAMVPVISKKSLPQIASFH